MKQILAFLLVLVTPQVLLAGGDFFIPSKVGTSAHMIRQGNIEGFSDLAHTVFENPAALYRVDKGSTSLFMTTFMDEVNYKNVAAAIRMPVGMLGIGYMNLGVQDIPDTALADSNDPISSQIVQIGSFNYDNTLIKAAYQISQTRNLHFGASLSYYSTKIKDITGSGFNVDAGMIVDLETVGVSVVMRNLLSNLKVDYSNSQSENLPLESVYSGWLQTGDMKVLGQLKISGSQKKLLKSFGLNFRPSFFQMMEASAGYKEFLSEIQEIQKTFTVGVGLRLMDVYFDYAYEQSEHILYNHKHYFSLGLNF